MDRRAILAGSGSGWTPQSACPIAWFYAASPYVTLSGANVTGWLDRSGNGNNLDQSSGPSQPTWEASGGWSSSKSSINFLSQSLNNVSGTILTSVSGIDKPFTVLCTCQPTGYSNALTVCSWDDTLITARQNCTITSGQLLSSKREENTGASITVTASGPSVGTNHVRLAYAYNGANLSAYVDSVVSINAAAFGLGAAATFSRFRLGDGPEVGPDSFIGRYVEAVFYARALTASEVAAYYSYSLNEWG